MVREGLQLLGAVEKMSAGESNEGRGLLEMGQKSTRGTAGPLAGTCARQHSRLSDNSLEPCGSFDGTSNEIGSS